MKNYNINKIILILCVFFIFGFSNINNKQNLIFNENCKGNLTNKVEISSIPKSINIKINNVQKWYQNILRIITYTKDQFSSQIPYELKKYYKAKIIVEYSNNFKCIFNGRVKTHGRAMDHIGETDLTSSIRVEIFDGHINNINKFVLFRPETRTGDNEIFISALLNRLEIISPLTFKVNVKFANFSSNKMLFQERLTEQLLKRYNKRPGPILAGNKNRFGDSEITNTGLSRILNFGGLDINSHYHKDIFLKALDKTNFGYLLLKNFHENEIPNYSLPKSLFENNNRNYEKMSVFESIMIAAGGLAGLNFEDRRFYFDAINDSLEPIYYDGMTKIILSKYNPTSFKLNLNEDLFISDFQIDGAKKAKLLLSSLNLDDLFIYLEELGLGNKEGKYNYSEKPFSVDSKFQIEDLNLFINLILENLTVIENNNQIKNQKNYSNKDFFANNRYSNQYDFSLAFDGKKNKFLICDIFLKNCEYEILDDNEFYQLITSQIAKIKGKKIRYVRNNLQSYKENTIPIVSGIKKMQNINLNKSTQIFFNKDVEINIDKKNKIIQITQKNNKGKLIIKNGYVEDWNFHFKGNGKINIDYKTDSNNLGGCITFLDVKVNNISVYLDNAPCPNAVHFLKTSGNIKNINLNNTSADAFDADFSKLKVKEVFINNTGGECIGVKQGKYFFEKSILKYCGDRAISSGELANTELIDVEIYNSSVGLAAKDSSIIKVKKAILKDVNLCILSTKYKINYSGSLIQSNKKFFNCGNANYQIDKSSKWENN